MVWDYHIWYEMDVSKYKHERGRKVKLWMEGQKCYGRIMNMKIKKCEREDNTPDWSSDKPLDKIWKRLRFLSRFVEVWSWTSTSISNFNFKLQLWTSNFNLELPLQTLTLTSNFNLKAQLQTST